MICVEFFIKHGVNFDFNFNVRYENAKKNYVSLLSVIRLSKYVCVNILEYFELSICIVFSLKVR